MQDAQSKPTLTGSIYATALRILDQYPEGLRWVDLNKAIISSDPQFHPKTVNGCIWRLTERYPDDVYKHEKGLFRLVKYRSAR